MSTIFGVFVISGHNACAAGPAFSCRFLNWIPCSLVMWLVLPQSEVTGLGEPSSEWASGSDPGSSVQLSRVHLISFPRASFLGVVLLQPVCSARSSRELTTTVFFLRWNPGSLPLGGGGLPFPGQGEGVLGVGSASVRKPISSRPAAMSSAVADAGAQAQHRVSHRAVGPVGMAQVPSELRWSSPCVSCCFSGAPLRSPPCSLRAHTPV